VPTRTSRPREHGGSSTEINFSAGAAFAHTPGLGRFLHAFAVNDTAESLAKRFTVPIRTELALRAGLAVFLAGLPDALDDLVLGFLNRLHAGDEIDD
jgi:hypothetical protein